MACSRENFIFYSRFRREEQSSVPILLSPKYLTVNACQQQRQVMRHAHIPLQDHQLFDSRVTDVRKTKCCPNTHSRLVPFFLLLNDIEVKHVYCIILVRLMTDDEANYYTRLIGLFGYCFSRFWMKLIVTWSYNAICIHRLFSQCNIAV